MAKRNKLPKVLGLLREYFIREIHDRNLAFQEVEPELYILMGGPTSIIFYDGESGHNTSIIPILRQDQSYWLSLVISMKGTTSEIGGVSLSVYSGNFTDAHKAKLFRAEWTQNSHHSHAQPHWHLHPSEAANWSDRPWNPEEESIVFSSELRERVLAKVKKIHFAMAAQWHKEKASHIVDLRTTDENQVVKWVCYTFEYIIYQLTYLEDKSSL